MTEQVLREFAGLHHVLSEQAGVNINLFQHAEFHGTPDAVRHASKNCTSKIQMDLEVEHRRMFLNAACLAAVQAFLTTCWHFDVQVFPNNWFSTHAAGEGQGSVKENTLVLYPMKTPNRSATACRS